MNTEFNKSELIACLNQYITQKIPNVSIENSMDTSFSSLGLDSADHVQLTTIIEDQLSVTADPSMAFEYPTLNSLVAHIIEKYELAETCG